MAFILGYLIIFFARVVDVSLGTLRVLFIVRGQRVQAAVTGFFEVIIFLVALGMVVQDLDNPWKVVVYSLGFATGCYVGSILEEKLAMGFVTVQIITRKNTPVCLAGFLREKGFGVTAVEGEGRLGPRPVLLVTTQRKHLRRLLSITDEVDPKAFVTILETRSIRGGVFLGRKGK